MGRKSRSGSGRVSRRAALALIAGGGTLGLTASGSFDVVEGNRPFDVGVVNDDDALLRLVSSGAGTPSGEPLNAEVVDFVVDDGETVDLATVENRFGDGLEFATLRADPAPSGWGGADVDLAVEGQPLSMNETTTLSGTFTCPAMFARASVDLSIEAETGTGSIDATRTVNVTCLGDPGSPAVCDLPGAGATTEDKVVPETSGKGGGKGGGGSGGTEPIEGDYNVTVSGKFDADIDVTGTVDVENGAEVGGDVVAGETVTIGNGGKVDGKIETGGSLVVDQGGQIGRPASDSVARIEVCGDMTVRGSPNITVEETLIVGGTLGTNGGPHITVLNGGMSVGCDIDLSIGNRRGGGGRGSGIKIDVDDDLIVGGAVDMTGNRLTTGGDLVVGGDLDVPSGGRVTVGEDLVVGDDLFVASGSRLTVGGKRVVAGEEVTERDADDGCACGSGESEGEDEGEGGGDGESEEDCEEDGDG
jgi:hypothetical protein